VIEHVPPPDGIDDQKFIDAMAAEDAFGAVVRGVIYIEHELIALAAEVAVYPDAIKGMRLSYSGRVALAVTLGLVPTLQPALDAIGRLRNKYAHDPNFEVTGRDINELTSSLDDNVRRAIDDSVTRISVSTAGQHPPTFDRQTTRNKLTLIMLCLRQSVRAARTLASGRKPNVDQSSQS
jgi:hypothetical protein